MHEGGGRLKLTQELVRYARRTDERGLVVGPGGNFSAREGKTVLIKASGACMADGRAADYLEVDLDSGKAAGEGVPSCELPLHLAVYRARPEARAVLHAHPTWAVVWAEGGETLRASSPDFVALLGTEVPVLPYTRPAGEEVAQLVGEALKAHAACIISNHGSVAWGGSIREAYFRTLLLDEMARTAVLTKLCWGRASELTAEEAAFIDDFSVEHYRRKKLAE